MTNPAFIVDGDLEFKTLQRLCPGTKVNKSNCNGKDVEINVAASRIASLIRLMDGKYYPIIILYDREDRVQTSSEIAEQLEKCLREEKVNDQLIIGVPDRMIENWILGDVSKLIAGGKLRKKISSSSIEGTKGKSIIRKYLPKGRIYHETVEGVNWFISANPLEIYNNCLSFKNVVDKLRGIKCPWLLKCTDSITDRN